jgi:secondary thiamine-phosphate synthase enzyme
MWIQKDFIIKNKNRGFHLITREIEKNIPEIIDFRVGILNLFVKHTSASLTINENTDESVRNDFEYHFNKTIPENDPNYEHTFEGSDDMPAHLKSSILGNSVSVPIKNGTLDLGTWQGIFLCEHRNNINQRNITAIMYGISA